MRAHNREHITEVYFTCVEASCRMQSGCSAWNVACFVKRVEMVEMVDGTRLKFAKKVARFKATLQCYSRIHLKLACDEKQRVNNSHIL